MEKTPEFDSDLASDLAAGRPEKGGVEERMGKFWSQNEKKRKKVIDFVINIW